MSDFFDLFENELRTAIVEQRVLSRRRRLWNRIKRLSWRSPVVIAVGGATLVGGGALAVSDNLPFNTPLAQQSGIDKRALAISGEARIETVRLLAVRADDPQGGPQWGIRTFETNRGRHCAQLGRVVRGRLVNVEPGRAPVEIPVVCSIFAEPGAWGFGSGDGRTILHGLVGPEARRYVIDYAGEHAEGEVRDGAFVAVLPEVRATLENGPKITLVFADGSRRRLDRLSGPLPGAQPARPELPDSVPQTPVRVTPRRGSGTTTFEVTFESTVAITDFKYFLRADIIGPRPTGNCARRGLGGTQTNVGLGEKVTIRIERPVRDGKQLEWCRGDYRGRVALNGQRELGTFTVTIR